MTVLILGGTAEARDLAAELQRRGVPVVSSLAGRVSRPALPVGEVRVGGFGGVQGLTAYLAERRVTTIVDATHPFAAQMSAHAAAAARAHRCSILRLERPSWAEHPKAATWHWAPDTASARDLADPHSRPFLTTGRQTLREFLPWRDRAVLVRVVDPPAIEWPSRWRLITARGPYDAAAELTIMREHGADVLITKDSGGSHTVGKLAAAADLGVPVVIIRRPAPPPGVPLLPDVRSVLDALGDLTGSGEGVDPGAV
jgi:precorrin-6A/cobalt-precorrin-6A reductase